MVLSDSARQRLVLVLVGALQGVVSWLTAKYWPTEPHAAAVLASILTFTLIFGWTFQLLWRGRHIARLLSVVVSVAAVFALVALWVWWQLPGQNPLYHGDSYRTFTFILASAVAVYVLIPFGQIFYNSGRFSFSYMELFRHSWNTPFIILVATMFTGLYWTLIYLWGALFGLLAIEFFKELFSSAPFVHVTTYLILGLGLALGKESNKIINTLRRITLLVFRTLMPLLAFIALLFLATLPVTGLQPLWDTKAASPLLLILLLLTILFINAVLQDGSGAKPYTLWVRKGVEGMLLAMPVFAALALYAIGLRIAQYGITPDRLYTVLIVIITGLYALGYAAAVPARQAVWLGVMRPVNVAVSLIIVGSAVLLHTPVLDPLGWSARNQYARLVEGKVDAEEFDYGSLRFRFGHAGYAKLKALQKLRDHAQANVIRDKIAITLEAKSYYSWREGRVPRYSMHDVRERISSLLPEKRLPTEFLKYMTTTHRELVSTCMTSDGCFVFLQNLDDDPGDEYVFIPPGGSHRDVLVFDRVGVSWKRVAKLIDKNGRRPWPGTLIDELRNANIELVTPKFGNMKVGDSFYFVNELKE